jgi:uncharacterized RDD family membrane protein YckC
MFLPGLELPLSDYADKLVIDTPENVPLDADIAGFGTRCVAATLDYLILLVVMVIVFVLFFRSVVDRIIDEPWIIGLLAFLIFVIFTGYHLLFEFMWNGQTPGKRRLNLRVVQSNGLPATTSGILIRNLVRLFDFLPVFYGVGLIVLFATKQTQRLGDLAASTIVIRERPQVTLLNLRENLRVDYLHISRLSPIPEYINITPLTEDDRREVLDYLRRRTELASRDYVATVVARQIGARMNFNEPGVNLGSPRHAETFLELVARAFELADQPS